MLWIALTLPDLPLQAITRAAPESGPLAVTGPRARLLSANAAAQALGVRAGTSVTDALAAAPQLELRQCDPALEHEALNTLAVMACRFTPSVSLQAPDAILIEVSSCLKLFGNVRTIIRQATEACQELGLNVVHAAAPTPLAAHWLANYAPGLVVEPRPGWQAVLDKLPVQALACGAQVAESVIDLITGVGIDTIGRLQALPREGLARRQARSVLDTLARAHGHTPDPRLWFTLPARFSVHITLPAPTQDVEPLLFACDRLFTDLATWLKAGHAATDQCMLHLEHERHPASKFEIIAAAPTQDKRRWLTIARERLAVTTLAAPVEILRLEAEGTLKIQQASADLFGDPTQDDEAADHLLERLRARFGTQSVHALRTWPDHRPEKAWRCAEPGTDYPALPGKRPLWLLPQPRPLQGVDAYRIEAGPERIETGWWDGEEVLRDYFVARAPDASRLWIFRDLRTSRDWFVHGYFG
ncbi:MAG TPA: DNA polymerase Y family protein [Azoarcus taiwanensis]|nr:DNA polymerase Y family protein [Azoarcus taiwanensis]